MRPNQVTVVEEVTSGEMLLRTGETVMTIMREFQVSCQQAPLEPLPTTHYNKSIQAVSCDFARSRSERPPLWPSVLGWATVVPPQAMLCPQHFVLGGVSAGFNRAAITVQQERCAVPQQEAQKAYLQRDLSEGLLCAVINNNMRCYNESTEFADHLDDALAAPYKVLPCQTSFLGLRV